MDITFSNDLLLSCEDLLNQFTWTNSVVFVHACIPWTLSALTLWSMFLAGEMKNKAWTVGLLNQALWAYYIVITKQWPLIPMNLGMWYMCFRNHLLWTGNANPYLVSFFITPQKTFRTLFGPKSNKIKGV
jgi:hypothetical protein